ncbi:MAG TPA: hypothetical protein DCO83_14415 [Mucilaginibacter sp.]|nr:hypothetical protein [Mucilaginibacter sp.]
MQFAGYTWNVTNSGGASQGPGPNIFDPSYAWVDASGFLHLKLAKSATDSKYHGAEVTLAQNLWLWDLSMECRRSIGFI